MSKHTNDTMCKDVLYRKKVRDHTLLLGRQRFIHEKGFHKLGDGAARPNRWLD